MDILCIDQTKLSSFFQTLNSIIKRYNFTEIIMERKDSVCEVAKRLFK